MQYIAGFFIITTVLSGTYGLWTKIELQRAEAQVQTLTIERDAALETVKTVELKLELQMAQVRESQQAMAELAAENARARAAVEYTQILFNDHNLGELMAKKPGLITNRMEKASAKVLSDLESATQ